MELPFFAKFYFELSMPDCKTGKEGVYMTLHSLLNKKVVNGRPLFMWNKIKDNGKSIDCSYKETPFSNLVISEELSISGNSLCFKYTEKTSEQLMLPNILFYVNMLLMAIKAADKVNGGFDRQNVNCHITIEHNGNCFFYEKFSPLAVDYSFMLKYGIDKAVEFDFKIEGIDDIYLLINRFYQQYKTAQSMVKPYVTVVKDSFEEVYNGL